MLDGHQLVVEQIFLPSCSQEGSLRGNERLKHQQESEENLTYEIVPIAKNSWIQ